MTNPIPLTKDDIDIWADDPKGYVALHLKQKLVPIEGEGGVIFPPTYADVGYNIDTLSDGTKVVTIDSVGSQANRMEPIYKREPYSTLVPQIEIELHTKEHDGEKHIEKRSLLDLAHRSADAVVLSSPTLAPDMAKAFRALKQRGDAGPLCRLAPTSLLFGVWDSRGGSGEKRPRLILFGIMQSDKEGVAPDERGSNCRFPALLKIDRKGFVASPIITILRGICRGLIAQGTVRRPLISPSRSVRGRQKILRDADLRSELRLPLAIHCGRATARILRSAGARAGNPVTTCRRRNDRRPWGYCWGGRPPTASNVPE